MKPELCEKSTETIPTASMSVNMNHGKNESAVFICMIEKLNPEERKDNDG